MKTIQIFNKAIKPELKELAPLRHLILNSLLTQNLSQKIIIHSITAIHEICTNLLKHQKDKTEVIRIEINITGNTDCNETLCISIKDNGSSFSNFKQIINATDDSQLSNGLSESGMGMFIIKSMFPKHIYQSKSANDDNLNCFSLYHDISNFKVNTQPTNDVSIAIIDDSISMCHIIASYLRDKYQIKTYNNAKYFLDSLAAGEKFDLVISDISMPGMDGLDLKRKLSQANYSRLIPFIFLTAQNDETTQHIATGLSIADFLEKPVTKMKLLAVIRRVLIREQQVKTTLGNVLNKYITQSLRPELPDSLGQFSVNCISKNAEMGGGDFVYHFVEPCGDVIILADVMGHDINSKFFAHAYGGYLKGLITSVQKDALPAEILKMLSTLLYEDPLFQSTIMTCCVVKLMREGDIILANAGNPYPILVNHNKTEYIKIDGSLPGLTVNYHYQNKFLKLETQQRLLLYTDGLFEIGSNTMQRHHSKASMIDTINNSSQLNLADASKLIMTSYENLTRANKKDDATLILIEPKG